MRLADSHPKDRRKSQQQQKPKQQNKSIRKMGGRGT
jgi:hypothetical protein